jgi:hypothetical protein
VTTGPGYTDPNPGGYEAPDGVEATIPGAPDDAGSRDPSAATIPGAVANAYAQMRELEASTHGPGSSIGDEINRPAPLNNE